MLLQMLDTQSKSFQPASEDCWNVKQETCTLPLQFERTDTSLWLCSKEKKLLKSMKFPKEYDQKVDLKKVKWEVMKTWIATRVTELLGAEDEVLVGYIYEQLEGKQVLPSPSVCSYDLQLQSKRPWWYCIAVLVRLPGSLGNSTLPGSLFNMCSGGLVLLLKEWQHESAVNCSE